MSLIVHLSDVHLARGAGQRALFESLVATLRAEETPDASKMLVFTGDLFDSATQPAQPAITRFLSLHERMVDALGGAVPTVVIPGNHDRRRSGLFGPHRSALFDALHEAADPTKIFVGGCRTPFLAEIVPPSFHRLAAHVVAYDSSYLPRGLVSAGGTIRHEDLLAVHARLPDDGLPLLFLIHHHLIPTPLTDVSGIAAGATPRIAKWLLRSALPTIVSNADREELTMTALGAGTALSTLHAFGRPVLLLHGHKHFPTARLLRGVLEGSGDVLLTSAGSAGVRERLHTSKHADVTRLWPSFNLAHMDETSVHVEAVSFSPRPNARLPMRRDLVRARREEARWEPTPVSSRVRGVASRVALDEASFVLSPSKVSSHWDYSCARTVQLKPGASLGRYVDFVRTSAGKLETSTPSRHGRHRKVELATSGITRYQVSRGLCRTVSAAEVDEGPGTAFSWLGLLCRHGAGEAVLSLDRRTLGHLQPFGSVTDLSTGRERPARLEETETAFVLRRSDCAPRTMLRIYWPLER